MCGILGWLGQHASGDESRFGAALDLLAHRGPEGLISNLASETLGVLKIEFVEKRQQRTEPFLGASLSHDCFRVVTQELPVFGRPQQ